MDPSLILAVMVFSLIGASIGLMTGLIPGIHVNTLASMLLVSYPMIEAGLSDLVDVDMIPVYVCCIIMSASVVHSFVDFVPSVFLGAPDAEDAVSILPGHRLLLDGKGMVAVRSAAIGSLVGCSVAIAIAVPIQYIMMSGMADMLDGWTKSVLVLVTAVLLFNEHRKGHLLFGIAAFILSGALGYLVMEYRIPCEGIFGDGTLLMPMLTGLFGLPMMLTADTDNPIPPQKDEMKDPVGFIPGIRGVVMGSIAGWFPGITSTVGATISATVMPERSPERFISAVASIGSVTTILSLVTLSISGGGRSGTVIVIGEILGESVRGLATAPFLLLLMSSAFASLIGYCLTIWSSHSFIRLMNKISQRMLNRMVIVFLVAITMLMTGPWGMVILICATFIGFIPVTADTGRTVLCGCLILPVLLI